MKACTICEKPLTSPLDEFGSIHLPLCVDHWYTHSTYICANEQLQATIHRKKSDLYALEQKWKVLSVCERQELIDRVNRARDMIASLERQLETI